MNLKKNETNIKMRSSSCAEKNDKKKKWEKPKLEDVSGKVMAQPYIRFT